MEMTTLPVRMVAKILPSELLDRVAGSEGVSRMPYRDSGGLETLGIGHNLNKPISLGACDYILRDDLTDAQAQIDVALPWTANLDAVRYWTLIELCFNMGLGVAGGNHGLLGFTNTIAAIENRQYANAGKSLLQSKWAEEVGQERSERIAKQLETGEWA
jgi:GH24 family phage-related lysozyme (muramidase)